jgi:hypothetical protein
VRHASIHLAAAERERGQLEGVKWTAGMVADRMSNSLAVAASTLALLEDLHELPEDLHKLVTTARARLFEAGEDLKKLQRVTHVETRTSTVGKVLDLDRSAIPLARVNGQSVVRTQRRAG